MSTGTIQIPVLFDMSGDTIVFGEDGGGDFVSSHLDFLLDMTTEANDISLNAADISSAIFIGDQDDGDSIFYAGGTTGNIAVDNLCNRIANAITRGKLVHIPKSGNTSNSGIPMGGRSLLYNASGQADGAGKYAIKYITSVAPIGDEQMLGQAMARVASIHLVGSPLSAGIFQDATQVQTDLETASGQTFNSGGSAFYNALAVQLSKVLGGSKSSAPMKNGSSISATTTTFNAGTKITASDPTSLDQFGSTVDVSGNFAIIGSPNWDGDNDNEGAAYIFNVTTGNQVHKLTASDGAEGDTFGHGAAIDGNYAIVGAHGEGTTGGAAYIFDLTATPPSQQKITASDGAADDYFGRHVAISGNNAIISASGDNDNGSAYIFNVTNGNQLRKLTASDGASGDEFGASVSIHGNYAIVSTYVHNSYQGAAYIFNVTTGNQVHKLTASDGAASDYFGRDSVISGNYAIVGADGEGTTGGAAYIFDVTTGNQLHKLTASDGAADDYFGASVAIYGNFAIVGAGLNDDTASASGSVYIFDVTTGNQLGKMVASDPGADERFGQSVAITDNYFIVGKPYDTNGSAYIFTYTTNTNVTHPLDASGVACPALKSIYEQLMNVPGRSQIMQTRDISGVVDNSNVTLAGGFPFIAGDKLVMYLRPKIQFAAQTHAEQNHTVIGFPTVTGPSVPVYNIGRKSTAGGTISGQTYTESSAFGTDSTANGFHRAFQGTKATDTSSDLERWRSSLSQGPMKYFSTSPFAYRGHSSGETTNVDGSTTLDGQWGQVDIGQNTVINKFEIWPQLYGSAFTGGNHQDTSPATFSLLGSLDGTNWTTIKAVVDDTDWGTQASPVNIKSYDLGELHGPYRYYRISIQNLNGNMENVIINQLLLHGVKHPSQVVSGGANAQPTASAITDISGLITNVTATAANIETAFPGNAIIGNEAELNRWGWIGSANSDSLSLDTTDTTDTRTIDLHIWKITITL